MNTQQQEVNVTNIVDNLYTTYKELGHNNLDDLQLFMTTIMTGVIDRFLNDQFGDLKPN